MNIIEVKERIAELYHSNNELWNLYLDHYDRDEEVPEEERVLGQQNDEELWSLETLLVELEAQNEEDLYYESLENALR